MKTDPFDDAIRRKLEGASPPPYQEKNWTQFQRFMGHQGFPPSLWQTPARWLQPALMAAAITGLVISTIWQYRTTQSLTSHVQTLTKTVDRMEQVQLRLQQSVAAMASVPARIDTVYLTQPNSGDVLATTGREVGRAPASGYGNAPNRRQSTTGNTLATVGVSPAGFPAGPVTRAGYSQTEKPTQYQARTQRMTSNQPGTAAGQRMAGQQPATEQRPFVSIPPEARGRVAATGQTEQTGTSPAINQPVDYQPITSTTRSPTSNDATLYTPSVTNSTNTNDASIPENTATTFGTLAAVQPLAPRALADPAGVFAEGWQRHLRRVRYRSPYTTTMGATEATSPEKNTVPLPIRFRLGIGGDLATTQSGPGVYAEAIVANRLTLGIGISQVAWKGDEYSTENQFMVKTKRDFRRDYPGSHQAAPSGPGRQPEVMNISRATQSTVVPLQIGYRFNVAKQLVLTPTLGLDLSITPRETVNFEYDRPIPREDILRNVVVSRPVGWYSNVTVGVAAERQWGHFVGQLSPVVLLPVQQSPASLNSLTAGLRGRLFYQF